MICDNDIKGIDKRKEYIESLLVKLENPNLVVLPELALPSYNDRRKRLYNQTKDREISLILFPHRSPADPNKLIQEKSTNDYFCGEYLRVFNVPIAYVNSVGKLGFMLGKAGKMMAKAGFRLNGLSKIYCNACLKQ